MALSLGVELLLLHAASAPNIATVVTATPRRLVVVVFNTVFLSESCASRANRRPGGESAMCVSRDRAGALRRDLGGVPTRASWRVQGDSQPGRGGPRSSGALLGEPTHHVIDDVSVNTSNVSLHATIGRCQANRFSVMEP
jgi:hypothetical protein